MLSANLDKESPSYQREVLSKARFRQEQLKVLSSPEYLIKLLGYEVVKHHQKMLDFVSRKKNGRSLILAPRGAGKSSIISIGYVLWKLLNNPSLRILLVSNSQSQATGFLREIKQHCERNKTLTFLFGNLIGEKWSEIEIDLGIRENFTKEANISAYGIFGALISRHYDMIIMDDLVNQEIAISPTQREKLEQWVGMSLMPTLEPGGKVIVLGTRYHVSDLYGKFSSTSYKNDNIQIKAISEKGKSYWPEYFPIDILLEIKEEIGTPFFNAQYQNNPQDMSGGLFKIEWFRNRWRDYGDEIIGVPEWQNIQISDLEISQGFDQAMGMREMHDFNVHVTVGRNEKTGDIYMLEEVRGRFTFEEKRSLLIKQYEKWLEKCKKVKAVAIESIGFQDELAQSLLRTTSIPVIRIIPRHDKVTRATPVATLAENGKLILGIHHNDFRDELVFFPEGEHDDRIDALEMAIQGFKGKARIIQKPLGM